jgi:hypothetical protein
MFPPYEKLSIFPKLSQREDQQIHLENMSFGFHGDSITVRKFILGRRYFHLIQGYSSVIPFFHKPHSSVLKNNTGF